MAALLLAAITLAVSADQANPAAPPAGKPDLAKWKLTLPVDASGSYGGRASEISTARLVAGFTNACFQIEANGALAFWCPVTGATTQGTRFPRSELREMLDPKDPSVNWTARGTHVLSARCRVTQIPSSEKVVIGQIHSYGGEARPLVKLQYHRARIEALVKASPTQGKDIRLVWPEVGLGSDFTYRIELRDGALSVTVNGIEQTQDILRNDPAWADQTFYFKAGVYPQDHEGPASEGARAVFSELKVTHGPAR